MMDKEGEDKATAAAAALELMMLLFLALSLWRRRFVIFEGRAGVEEGEGEQGQKFVRVLAPRSKQAASS